MHDRFLCQFRDVGKDYFKTDCSFQVGQADKAANYVNWVVNMLPDSVAEGQVFDQQTREVIYQKKNPRWA